MTSATRTRNRRGEGGQLREELVTTASRLLDELGDADELTLRGLAAEIGITAPSIYRHFPDKAALLSAVVEREFHDLDTQLRAAAEVGGDDPFDALLRAGEAYLAFARTRPTHYGVLFSGDGMPCAAPPPDFVEKTGGHAFETLVELVAACLAAGPGGAAVDPVRFAVEVWCTLHGLVVLPRQFATFPFPPPDEVLAAAVDRLRVVVAAPVRSR